MQEFKARFIAARRAVIERDLHRLNPMQRKAAMTTEGPLLLLAGAGSGKTTVLIQRIYNLLTYGRGSDCESVEGDPTEEDLRFLETFLRQKAPTEADWAQAKTLCAVDPPRPWEIIAITFTNKAAGELKDRLAARLGDVASDIWASTFHSACVRILRRNIDRIGFERDFTIYDTDDSKRLIRDIAREMDLDEKALPIKNILSTISRAKDQYMGPEEFERRQGASSDWRMQRIAQVYRAYQKRLASANALDFDDIIFHTVTLLRQEEDVRSYYQQKFRYVSVDEYQDTNHLQSLLTGLLAGGWENLCVVGDDDQSIYRFRGANIENILGFEKQYPAARVIRLEQNYRSTQPILDAANAVIQHNSGRKGKTLWTEKPGGQAVRVRATLSESDEASFVVGDILTRIGRGSHFRDAAILYRMNAQSNALEYAMKRNSIPYRIVGGMKFFDRAEIRDMLAYLCVLNNPLDDLRLRRIVNTPARGIGGTTMDRVAAVAAEQGSSLFEVIRNADCFPVLKMAASKLLRFADMIDGLREEGSRLALPDFYDAVCEKTGYVQTLQEKRDMESRGRLENVRELKSSILGFVERQSEDATLTGFLNEIALYTDLDAMGDGRDDDCVTMMTIHAAKGLEFPLVYVVGLEDGIFPGNSALFEPEDLEEERRLCYVAMTRAKDELTMTFARQRMLYGRTASNRPSRFLDELPREGLDWEDRSQLQRPGAPEGCEPYKNNQTRNVYREAIARRSASARQTSMLSSAPLMELSAGDRVEHRAFGRGRVLKVQPMGGDALVEVEFEGLGLKKLMLKAAGAHMKKV